MQRFKASFREGNWGCHSISCVYGMSVDLSRSCSLQAESTYRSTRSNAFDVSDVFGTRSGRIESLNFEPMGRSLSYKHITPNLPRALAASATPQFSL